MRLSAVHKAEGADMYQEKMYGHNGELGTIYWTTTNIFEQENVAKNCFWADSRHIKFAPHAVEPRPRDSLMVRKRSEITVPEVGSTSETYNTMPFGYV